MSTIVEVAIFPMDKGQSVSSYVARAVKIIKESGLRHEMNPMGTCIEGEWPEVMAVVDRCFRELQKDCGRIYLSLKADYRQASSDRLRRKVAAVQNQLNA